MDFQFEQLIEKVTQFIKTETKTETVIGEPFQLGEFSCVPVIKLGIGFGTGGGGGNHPKQGQGEGGGAGAGMRVEPIGFLISRGDSISFLGAQKTKGISAVFEKVPDLMEQFMKGKKQTED